MALKDLFADNSTRTWLTYEARYASRNLDAPVDMLLSHSEQMFYGRINYERNAVYPSEAFLKEIEEGVYVLNFVADAYKDLKKHYQKLNNLRKITPEAKIKNVSAKQGWVSLVDSHHEFVKLVFRTFFDVYDTMNHDTSLEEFNENLVTFIRESRDLMFVTRSAFIESILYDPLMSGLSLELTSDTKGKDSTVRKYYEDENFETYLKTLRMFGFKADARVPWRIVADIESTPMLEYLQNYDLTNKSLFNSYYYKAFELDIDVLKQYIREYYNTLQRAPAVDNTSQAFIPIIQRTTNEAS